VNASKNLLVHLRRDLTPYSNRGSTDRPRGAEKDLFGSAVAISSKPESQLAFVTSVVQRPEFSVNASWQGGLAPARDPHPLNTEIGPASCEKFLS